MAYTAAAMLGAAREGFLEIGYPSHLLQENYSYVDMLAQDEPLRQIDLAAFAQEPLDYRSACIGIAIPSHKGAGAIINYRALGALQILAFYPETQEIYRWKMQAQSQPVLMERFDAAHLTNAILANRETWKPEQILRAKSIHFSSEPIQLDFFDVGLIPTLEDVVHRKLDRLLNEVIASCEAIYHEHHTNELNYNALFRLIFRLIAAKLLGDRQYPGNWLSSDVNEVIKEVEAFYFQHMPAEKVINDRYVQATAWDKIRTAFSFRNLSVGALAYIYENTLVSPETRKVYGTHATPPQVAEYIVQNLPIDELPSEERHIFEPFCGHAPFLTAALGRLRSLLPADIDISSRHDYFVRMLSGMEVESFACEAARNSLILADYPNPNGWRIANDNFYTSPDLNEALADARVVLCNPPYEGMKAAEALQHIMQNPPEMLGLVLPKVFEDGQSYREIRKRIRSLYDAITTVELPDNAFNYSDAETVLVLAHGQRTNHPTWKSVSVVGKDFQKFIHMGKVTSSIEVSASFIHDEFGNSFRYSPLQSIWAKLESSRRLSEIAEIHRGVQYNIPFEENREALVSNEPRSGFVKGLARVSEGFEPYFTEPFVYLNTNPEKMLYTAYKLPWEKPKLIANAARLSRGPWTIVATIDEQELMCYQNFHGIWPKSNFPIEVIAAILNSPIANAFLSTHQTSRHNKKGMIAKIPIPDLNTSQIGRIVSLVREYMSFRKQLLEQLQQTEYFERRCRGVLSQIDAELLGAYNLPNHLERELITYFEGHERPGPFPLLHLKPSPARRLYTSIIRVENVRNEGGDSYVDAVITNWNPHQIVSIPISLVPAHLQQELSRNTHLLAKVNVGANNAEELIFEDITLAPEPKAYDELA
jgi:hypothetical protein